MMLAIIAAHPDDEVIGAGAWMHSQRVRDTAHVRVIHVTDGAPRDMRDAHAAGFRSREAYARARRREAEAALRIAGLSPEDCEELGVVDQEASLDLIALTQRIAAVLRHERIDRIVTHPYEGGHPDHDATAFAVHAAHRVLRRDGHTHLPRICEMTSYHAGETGLRTGVFLPPHRAELVLPLSPAEQRCKREMLQCFVTQQPVLEAFADLRCERFRPAPGYDFTRPPHAGRLWYEHFPWGVDAPRWRQRAAQALAHLELEIVCR